MKGKVLPLGTKTIKKKDETKKKKKRRACIVIPVCVYVGCFVHLEVLPLQFKKNAFRITITLENFGKT